jgi:hypothetical protein
LRRDSWKTGRSGTTAVTATIGITLSLLGGTILLRFSLHAGDPSDIA